MPSWRDNKNLPEFNMNEVREIIFTWLDLISSEDVDRSYFATITPEVVQALKLAADKSSYLGRRFSGEIHRTEKCPKHQGRWSGLSWDENGGCYYGCHLTGWLPRIEPVSEGASNE